MSHSNSVLFSLWPKKCSCLIILCLTFEMHIWPSQCVFEYQCHTCCPLSKHLWNVNVRNCLWSFLCPQSFFYINVIHKTSFVCLPSHIPRMARAFSFIWLLFNGIFSSFYKQNSIYNMSNFNVDPYFVSIQLAKTNPYLFVYLHKIYMFLKIPKHFKILEKEVQIQYKSNAKLDPYLMSIRWAKPNRDFFSFTV